MSSDLKNTLCWAFFSLYKKQENILQEQITSNPRDDSVFRCLRTITLDAKDKPGVMYNHAITKAGTMGFFGSRDNLAAASKIKVFEVQGDQRVCQPVNFRYRCRCCPTDLRSIVSYVYTWFLCETNEKCLTIIPRRKVQEDKYNSISYFPPLLDIS